jgi:hypothetical protein
MINAEQGEIIVDLVRKHARMVRAEGVKPLRMINALVSAQEAMVPEQFLLPFGSGLRRTIHSVAFDEAALPPFVGALFNKIRRCGDENLAELESFSATMPHDAVLAGDAAALIALYQDPGAFRAGRLKAVEVGDRVEECSEKVQVGRSRSRKPKPVLLIAILAGHLGDPAIAPTPAVWPHLGLALLLWKDKVGVAEVLEHARALNQKSEAERGLAIIAQIFPDLEKWVQTDKLDIPRWERKFAIPIAARRIVSGERD